ncbi:hypothetical protein BQ8794_40029 [Mesorhizobium prunaredense]|uniref:Uncharacterized protein n=1 Tax=Mesorhizobium prunaredense TaxID=1631249 RepID=A0A1R3VBX6_9HYPH|nr:hypothetical protein BQ8794_40029 [Mesorhizobium prunaredense]
MMPACKRRLPALPVLTYLSTLRSGSRQPPFSARPDLNLNTPWGVPNPSCRIDNSLTGRLRSGIEPLQIRRDGS